MSIQGLHAHPTSVAWHQHSSACLSCCTGDPQSFTYPGKSFHDEDHEVKPEDLQNNMVLGDFRECGDRLFRLVATGQGVMVLN